MKLRQLVVWLATASCHSGSLSTAPAPAAPQAHPPSEGNAPEEARPLQVVFEGSGLTMTSFDDFVVLGESFPRTLYRLDAHGLRQDPSLTAGVRLLPESSPDRFYLGDIQLLPRAGQLHELRQSEGRWPGFIAYRWRNDRWHQVATHDLDATDIDRSGNHSAFWWHDDVDLVFLPYTHETYGFGWFIEDATGIHALKHRVGVCPVASHQVVKVFDDGPAFVLGVACEGAEVFVERIARGTRRVETFPLPGARSLDPGRCALVGSSPNDLYALLTLHDGDESHDSSSPTKPYVGHFDGKQWTDLRLPRSSGAAIDLQPSPDGSVWVRAEGGVWRGVPGASGATWTPIALPEGSQDLQITRDGTAWALDTELWRHDGAGWARILLPTYAAGGRQVHYTPRQVARIRGMAEPIVVTYEDVVLAAAGGADQRPTPTDRRDR